MTYESAADGLSSESCTVQVLWNLSTEYGGRYSELIHIDLQGLLSMYRSIQP